MNSCILDTDDLRCTLSTVNVIGWGAETKFQANVIIPKQIDVDIAFSNIGQAAVSANDNAFQPLWMHTPAHMRLKTGYLVDKREIRMYNQIGIILGLRQGDSGTCIYIVQHPKTGCIGMVIAVIGDMTIVTPLKDIFLRMGM